MMDDTPYSADKKSVIVGRKAISCRERRWEGVCGGSDFDFVLEHLQVGQSSY